jgi:hypothetical protein
MDYGLRQTKRMAAQARRRVPIPSGAAALIDDSAILDFLLAHVGWFDMYVEDDHAAYVRYCFEKPLDAEIFRARFDPKRAIQARGMSV